MIRKTSTLDQICSRLEKIDRSLNSLNVVRERLRKEAIKKIRNGEESYKYDVKLYQVTRAVLNRKETPVEVLQAIVWDHRTYDVFTYKRALFRKDENA